ncbi:MAG: hypothetical protein HXY19_04490 [Thermoanaerobaculaceae bacterium]|jgi:tetratricopeptide (TPR) repeat protein|nr:hypothetical protein [Thermoanaerobaculaceae bacterium]
MERGSSSSRRGRWLVLAVAVLWAVTAQAAHPFYEDLLRRGTEDFNRRDYERAARRLRIACFGLLDEPQVLAEGLTRLALAQAGANDRAGFAETFQRLEEVEERFAAYSAGSIAAEMRTAFEAMVLRFLPPARVAASPTFSRLLPRPAEILTQWPPAKRRKELEKRIREEPGDIRWRMALAELELHDGRADAAWIQADAALTLAPGNTYARRLRGRVLAAQGKWAAAAQELLAVGTGDEAEAARALLLSLVRLERWEEAERVLASLPAAVVADATVQRLREAVAARVQP